MTDSLREAWRALEAMEKIADELGSAPSMEGMPRRSLADKLAEGPTSAHVVEEVHVPLNLAYLTCTTGSTALQNIVAVTYPELVERVDAGKAALVRAGARAGDEMLVCYPPLANVFSRGAFDELSVAPLFLHRSTRDSFLLALCKRRPRLVIGESRFLRSALEDAGRLGLAPLVPPGTVFFACGTPLDPAFAEEAFKFGCEIHDLYGCQEFGWLVMDGTPLREDVVLVADARESGWRALVVGGLPTGDSFPVSGGADGPGVDGGISTYARRRSQPELELVVRACTAQSALTVERLARSILRIKGRVARVDPRLKTGAEHDVLDLRSAWPHDDLVATISGPRQTALFGRLLEAQEQYQAQAKTDPLWAKQGQGRRHADSV